MIFATSIAITKDLPDVKGDIQFNIRTFATEMGVKSIAFLGARQQLSSLSEKPSTACQVPVCYS